MAIPTYQPGVIETIKAAAGLTKFRFVGFDGDVCGANAKAVGVTERDYSRGDQAGIVKSGTVPVEVGGTITAAGQAIASDNEGKAVEASLPEATTPIYTADLIAINGYSAGDPGDYPVTAGWILVDLRS